MGGPGISRRSLSHCWRPASTTRYVGYGPALEDVHTVIEIDSSREDEAKAVNVSSETVADSEDSIVHGNIYSCPHTFLPIEVQDRWGLAR